MKSLSVFGKRENKKFRIRKAGLSLVLVLSGLLAGCQMLEESEAFFEELAKETVAISETVSIDDISVIDDMTVYSADEPGSLAYFYVTVRYGSEGRGTNHTFAEVNDVVRFADGSHVDTEVYAEALVQAGDENGPVAGMLGYGETESNATIRVRGNSSTAAAVKSYRLKLDDDAGMWRGQTNIALNKHVFDPSRIRNKLYFDILKDIPEVPSVRTQFVVLYIKDETAGETEFKNYGIFTQAEVPTKRYLKNHGMDANGYLYKVINFNWETNELIKHQEDPEYDEEAMDTVLSCRGREDNQKLLELVTAVNDMSIDIDYIIDTYFDRENYTAWLAYNILMGNIDTTMQNYYLYSPLNGNKWYFIPWDGDGSLRRQEWDLDESGLRYNDWESGVSNYWNVLLHQRFLKYESNRQQLAAKVEELYSLMTKEYLQEKITMYNSVVEPYVEQMPDVLHLSSTLEERNYIIETLCDEVEINYQKFQNSLTSLMPFWIYYPEQKEGNVVFSWGDAYDFSAMALTYDLKVSRYPDMRNPVIVAENLEVLGYSVAEEVLGEGRFYIEVTATSADGRTVDACNEVVLDGTYYLGVQDCTIE